MIIDDNVKVYTVFHAGRYENGVLQEEINMSHMSVGHPLMVEYKDYEALKKKYETLLKETSNVER